LNELYALPDHEVVQRLVPGIENKILGIDAACRRIGECSGVVPLAIDPAGDGHIYFADIGDYPFRQWQYIFTLQHLAGEGRLQQPFSAPLAVLDQIDETIGLAPSGFIFHVSRCGSTLIGKALGRSRRNIVINQGAPLQRGFWAAITDDFRQPASPTQQNLSRFRCLIGLMTRPRWPGAEAAFIKLISWNSLYLDFIRAACPAVPKLFLYRQPVEVIASVLQGTTAVLEARGHRQAAFLAGQPSAAVERMDSVTYLAACYANYFKTMLDGTGQDLSFVNYKHIGPDTYGYILKYALNLMPDRADYNEMLKQFQYHSKDDSDKIAFRDDSEKKRSGIPASDRVVIDRACDALMSRLEKASQNLFDRQDNTLAASVETASHGIAT